MKKCIAIILSSVMFLVSCSDKTSVSKEIEITTDKVSVEEETAESTDNALVESSETETTGITVTTETQAMPEEEIGDDTPYEYAPEYEGLNDQDLLDYMEQQIYIDLTNKVDTNLYYISSVKATYISSDYLEDLTYNSQKNIYFGYTLEELEEQFNGEKFVITLGENGESVAVPFEDYDDTYEKVLKNVAIGTGVIVICVVICVVSDGMAVPAVASIFGVAAKSGAICALGTGAISGITAGVITGLETGDMDAALKSAALKGSEGYKIGAIAGAVSGGFSEFTALYEGTASGLTMNEVAKMQKLGYDPKLIATFHSWEEFEVFYEAGLKAEIVNGKTALIRSDIDLNIVDEWGRTNLQRMKKGLSPLVGYDDLGNAVKYELHHVGQSADGPLAILTPAEHDSAGLHGYKLISEINRPEFKTIRKNFWKAIAKMYEEGRL